MLDACRPDYITGDKTPFLNALSRTGLFARLRPTFGFEPDGAYLAGLYPDQADQGAQFWHQPLSSPFRGMIPNVLAPILDRLPYLPKKVIRKVLTWMVRYRSASPHLSAAAIPFSLLDRFSLPVRVNLDQPGFCPFPTVFDLLREDRRPYLFHGAPQYRVTTAAALKRAKTDLVPPLDFAFFHIGNLDGTGHAFGPDTPETTAELNQVDRDLEQVYNLALDRFDQVHFVVMGDHGMVQVRDHIHLLPDLENLPLKPGKDYLYMLDSTMARFWFFTPRAKAVIQAMLEKKKGGRILTQKDRDQYHLNYSHNKFGDLIFLANPGVMIFPNFFQEKNPVRGMHGYAPENYGQQAALIIQSTLAGSARFEGSLDMRRVFPTLCDLLSLTCPDHSRAKSLVNW